MEGEIVKNPKVYLSGPMDHVSEDEGRGWRIEAKIKLESHSIQVFDPYDFEQDIDNPPALVKTDLSFILQSHGMLINASQNVTVWGSPMETLWARMHGIINIAFIGDLHPSPWLSAHATVVHDLDQATERMALCLSRL